MKRNLKNVDEEKSYCSGPAELAPQLAPGQLIHIKVIRFFPKQSWIIEFGTTIVDLFRHILLNFQQVSLCIRSGRAS